MEWVNYQEEQHLQQELLDHPNHIQLQLTDHDLFLQFHQSPKFCWQFTWLQYLAYYMIERAKKALEQMYKSQSRELHH